MQTQLNRITLPESSDTRMQAKKILLLEDDEDFRNIIKEFLESHLYHVVTVRNGVEGVREIMASDFEVILCDMMMPTLPGDMFYLAVERMRPHLCDRFIFMTGYKGDGKVADFVKKVNGTMLNKPFLVDDLLEMIAFVQVRADLAF
ncbi:MAG TPA: response regulator [Chthoniobacteraceae bacterium]|nr:response regulator [Chthoniobacteraceae bacterium]